MKSNEKLNLTKKTIMPYKVIHKAIRTLEVQRKQISHALYIVTMASWKFQLQLLLQNIPNNIFSVRWSLDKKVLFLRK